MARKLSCLTPQVVTLEFYPEMTNMSSTKMTLVEDKILFLFWPSTRTRPFIMFPSHHEVNREDKLCE